MAVKLETDDYLMKMDIEKTFDQLDYSFSVSISVF